MRVLVFALALLLSACAPSADLRIDTPTEPLAPGRLVVVPVWTSSHRVEAAGETLAHAEFESAEDHEAAFWPTFATALGQTLPALDVRLGEPADASSFVTKRALVRGVTPGYGRDRWTVESVSVPEAVPFEALDADYVLYIVDPSVAWTDVDVSMAVAGVGPARGRSMHAGAEMLLFVAGTGGGSPVVAHTVTGTQKASGIIRARLSRETWEGAIADLADRVASASQGERF